MSEPIVPNGPRVPRTPEPVPAPRKPGSGVRGTQILAGFGLGLAGAWALRLFLFQILEGPINRASTPLPALFAALFPTFALIAAILWCARTGRKGWAIGMAIYAGVGGLLLGGTALFIYVACSQMKI